jgi:hypothetical protein
MKLSADREEDSSKTWFQMVFGIGHLKCKFTFIVAGAMPNAELGSNDIADCRFPWAWWA